MPTFLRIRAVATRLGISVKTVYNRTRTDPDFPKPVKLGAAPHSPLGYPLSEVEAYEQRLMAARPRAA